MNFSKDSNQYYKYKYCKYLFRKEKLLGHFQDEEDIFSDTSSEGGLENIDLPQDKLSDTSSDNCIDETIEDIHIDTSSEEDDYEVLEMLMGMIKGDLHPPDEIYSLEYRTNMPEEINEE